MIRAVNSHPVWRKPTPPRQPVEHLILNFAAFQVEDSDKPAGAHHILAQIKELAAGTAESPVAFFIQGYEKSPQGRWQVARYAVQEGRVEDLGRSESAKMMQGETLEQFLADGLGAFPGARQVVFVNNTHGRGTDGLAAETIEDGQLKTSQRDTMSFDDCQQALQGARDRLGRPLDLVVFDSCLMGQFEVIHGLSDVAQAVVASPEVEGVPEPAVFPSPQVLIPTYKELLASPQLNSEDFARRLVHNTVTESKYSDRIGNVYNATPTLALYDSQRCRQAGQVLNELGVALRQALSDPQKRQQIVTAVKEAFSYPNQSTDLFGGGDPLATPLKDGKSFLEGLEGVVDEQLLRRADSSLDAATLEFFKGKMGWVDYSRVGPFSLYLPDVPRNLVFQGPQSRDINEHLQHLVKRGIQPNWAGSDVHELVGCVNDYQRQLQQHPDAAVEKALGDNQATVEELRTIQQSLSGKYGQERQALVAQNLPRIQALVTDLAGKLAAVDFKGFAERCNQHQQQRVKDEFQASFLKRQQQTLESYLALDGIPEGWAGFVKELAGVVSDEVLPAVLGKL